MSHHFGGSGKLEKKKKKKKKLGKRKSGEGSSGETRENPRPYDPESRTILHDPEDDEPAVVHEDPFDDDFDEENLEDHEGDGKMEVDGAEGEGEESRKLPKRPWLPSHDPEPTDGPLEFSNSAYTAFHRMTAEWPCLSIDIVPDELGHGRSAFPAQMTMVAGTQADCPENNKIIVMKLTQLHRTKHDSDDEASDSEDEDGFDDDAGLDHRDIPHHGGVNRIRVMPQKVDGKTYAATWADTRHIHVFDISDQLMSLANPLIPRKTTPPCFTFMGHFDSEEGFALDWNPHVAGCLASGDNNGRICVLDLQSQAQSGQFFTGRPLSVEDIKWTTSHGGENHFACGTAEGWVAVFDVRNGPGPVVQWRAHESDCNVLSWNSCHGATPEQNTTHLLATGADDGTFCIWDCRCVGQNGQPPAMPAAQYSWHQESITSIEWQPGDDSVLAVATAGRQVTIWDCSLEHDAEAPTKFDEGYLNLPPQLLFVHMGLLDTKEVRWHPQIPGLICTTAEEGFNFFKPVNL